APTAGRRADRPSPATATTGWMSSASPCEECTTQSPLPSPHPAGGSPVTPARRRNLRLLLRASARLLRRSAPRNDNFFAVIASEAKQSRRCERRTKQTRGCSDVGKSSSVERRAARRRGAARARRRNGVQRRRRELSRSPRRALRRARHPSRDLPARGRRRFYG